MTDKWFSAKCLTMMVAGATALLLLMPLPHPHAHERDAADINRDGRIDNRDMAAMRAEMGRDDCAASPCRADLNGDGRVNSDDVQLFRDAMGSSRRTAVAGGQPAGQLNTDLQENAGSPPDGEAAEEVSIPAGGDEAQGEEIAPAAKQFKDNNDGTVTDRETGLMWTKNADLYGDTVLYNQAVDYIERMNRGEHPNCGYSDWRLPTLAELRTLIDYTRLDRGGSGLPDGHPFESVKMLRFNSTSYVSAADHPWFISLYCGLVGHNVDSCFGFVWAVREAGDATGRK